VAIVPTDNTLFVKWDAAQQQAEEDAAQEPDVVSPKPWTASDTDEPFEPPTIPAPTDEPQPELIPAAKSVVRFYGGITLNPERYSRDLGLIQREVIDRLAGAGADLEISLDIQARKPEGFTEAEIRTISENARTLKFDPGGMGFTTD